MFSRSGKRLLDRSGALPSATLCLCLVLVFLARVVTAADTTGLSCSFKTQRTRCGDLACNKETKLCIPCTTDSQCYPGAMYCRTSDGTCRVSSFFSSFSFVTFLTMIFGCLASAIGVVGGLGGGGILVPMFAAMLSFPMQSAVALSQSSICGQSTLNMYFAVQQTFASQFPGVPAGSGGAAVTGQPDVAEGDEGAANSLRKKNRDWKRPLINYQYLSLLLPLGLIGTLIGGLVSKVISDLVRLIVLFLLLTSMLYRTLQKMRAQYKVDKAHNAAKNATDVAVTSAGGDEPQEEEENTNGKSAGSPASPTAPNLPTKLEDIIVEKVDQPQYPVYELSTNVACFFTLLIFNIIRQRVTCSSFWYWFCVVVPLVALSGCFYYSRQRLENMARATVDNLDVQDRTRPTNEESPLVTFKWNKYNHTYFPLIAVFAGAAAAMLGIGGALVLGTVLYEVGLIPLEVSVTSGMATFFFAFSAALQLLVQGSLVVDYGIVFFCIGVVSTAIGTYVFKAEIKKRGWNFLYLASMAFTAGGSLLLLGVYSIYNAVIVTKDGGSALAFGHLCTKK